MRLLATIGSRVARGDRRSRLVEAAKRGRRRGEDGTAVVFAEARLPSSSMLAVAGRDVFSGPPSNRNE